MCAKKFENLIFFRKMLLVVLVVWMGVGSGSVKRSSPIRNFNASTEEKQFLKLSKGFITYCVSGLYHILDPDSLNYHITESVTLWPGGE